ncbi:MAG: hypothetical protein ACREOO_30390 [bacterium]
MASLKRFDYRYSNRHAHATSRLNHILTLNLSLKRSKVKGDCHEPYAGVMSWQNPVL